MSSGSPSGSTTNTVQTKADPWSGIIPYLTGSAYGPSIFSPSPVTTPQDKPGFSTAKGQAGQPDPLTNYTPPATNPSTPNISPAPYTPTIPEGKLPYINEGTPPATNHSNNTPYQDPLHSVVPGILPQAAKLYNRGQYQFFPGQTFANFSQPTQSALNSMSGRLGHSYNDLDQASGNLMNNARGDYLNTNKLSPDLTDQTARDYLTQAASGQYLGSSPFMEAYGNDIMDKVNAQFSGRSGSAYQAKALGNELGNVAARLYGDERNRQAQAASYLGDIYGRGLDRNLQAGLSERGMQLQALNMVPEFEKTRAGLENIDISQALQSGLMQDQQNQRGIDQSRARFEFEQNAPWENLNRYSSIVNQVMHGTPAQSNESSMEPYYQNTMGNMLGGALAGSQLGSVLGLSNPWGLLLGAGMSLL